MANYYLSSVAYTAVAQFAVLTVYSVGNIVRQLAAPTVGNERCFRCTTAGTSGAAEAAWNLTRGATTTQGTAVFTEITGIETYQGTSWAAPFARMQTAVNSSFSAAGDTIFVSADHAETQAAATTITSAGTKASPQRITCVARPSSAIPPVAGDITTGGSVTTTGANGMTLNGCFYCFGLTFSIGSGAVGSIEFFFNRQSTDQQLFEQCTFSMPQTAGTFARFSPGAGGSTNHNRCTFLNCTVSFGWASGGINMNNGCELFWIGGSLTGTALTALIICTIGTACSSNVDIRGVDLSLLAGSSVLVARNSANTFGRFSFTNCKINANLSAVASGTPVSDGHSDCDLVVTDSGTNTSREEHYRFNGSIIATTSAYRTNGASDGVTHKSWIMESNANCSPSSPLFAPDIFVWIGTTGSHTAKLYVANIIPYTFTDVDFGFDLEYMGSGASPQATFVSSLANPAMAGTALTTDTQPWTGLSTPTLQRIEITFTTGLAGWVRIRPKLWKPSTTIYVDPLVTVT